MHDSLEVQIFAIEVPVPSESDLFDMSIAGSTCNTYITVWPKDGVSTKKTCQDNII